MNIYYNYISIINWRTATKEQLQAFLECCLQLKIDSEDLQTCQE